MTEPLTLAKLAERIDALEAHQKEIDDLIALLKDVRSALRVFVHLGNALKWLVGVGAACTAAWYFAKKTLQ